MLDVSFKVVVLVCINVLVCVMDGLYSMHYGANWIIKIIALSVHNGLFSYSTIGIVGCNFR